MTSRQTNASRGKVVNMLRPKHLRTVSGQSRKGKVPVTLSLQASDVDHDVSRREVIQHVPLRSVAESYKSCGGHGQTRDH